MTAAWYAAAAAAALYLATAVGAVAGCVAALSRLEQVEELLDIDHDTS